MEKIQNLYQLIQSQSSFFRLAMRSLSLASKQLTTTIKNENPMRFGIVYCKKKTEYNTAIRSSIESKHAPTSLSFFEFRLII